MPALGGGKLRPEDLIPADLLQTVYAAHLHGVLQLVLELVRVYLHALRTAAVDHGDEGAADEHAPSARALNTSRPVRMPPSTKIFIRPPTASAMAGSTSAVEGHWSSTRPPWLDTTMPAAPASMALRAPAGVMMPLRIKGLPANAMISRSS